MGYEDFFRLRKAPFRLAPDPDYYFPSDGHKEALDTLRYSIRAGEGFIQITGEPGTGKTLLLRTLLRNLGKEVSTALVLNPSLPPSGLLRFILGDLGSEVSANAGKEELLSAFSGFVMRKSQDGVRTVIIVDEAQDLPDDTLEELRLLSNLETEKKKLMQIILVGQLELEQKLASSALKQLSQRITIRYRLKPLSKLETAAYIYHRLTVAGGADHVRFSGSVLTRVHRESKGIPRLINLICERMLMAAYVEGTNRIGRVHLNKSLRTFSTPPAVLSSIRKVRVSLPLALVALIAVVALMPVREHTRRLVALSSARLEAEAESGRRTAGEPVQPAAAVPKAESSSLRSPEETAPRSESTSDAASSALPRYVFQVAPKRVVAVFDRDEKKFYVWEGGSSAPVLRGESKCEDLYLAKGLYLLGYEPKRGSFVFNQLSCFMAQPRLTAENLWRYCSRFTNEKVVPLLVLSSKDRPEAAILERAGEMAPLLNLWANTWLEGDIARFMSCYGDVIASYDTRSDQPSFASWSSFYAAREARFGSFRPSSLECSDHVYLLDPTGNDMAMVMFSQRYTSRQLSDSGVKVLFLRLQDDRNSGKAWKIIGNLWLG